MQDNDERGKNLPPQKSNADIGAHASDAKKRPDKKTICDALFAFLLMNIGTLCLAAGVYFFKSPNNFATGGVSGISIILANYLPLKQSDIMMIINAALLIVGFIFLGKGCTVKTIYCSLVYSAENMLFERLVPLDAPLTEQTFMELVYAMLLTGVGSAIIFNCRATSGGTDIVALILKKYTKIHTGRALLFSDLAIACCAFLFGIEAGLYSVLGLFAKAFIIDGVIESIGKSKCLTIITSKPEEIGRFIIDTLKRDYTRYDAVGGYTDANKAVLVCVCKRNEALSIKTAVKKADPASFVIITDATEIVGKGFREAM